MNENLMADKNKIVTMIIGSNLYGTNTPTSDKDYLGIFIADKEYYFGMKNIEEVSCDIKSKNESGKNNKDAVDFKYYELRQYFKLAFENNPNILETLFINKENILFKSNYFDEIIKNKNYFLNSEAIKDKYLAYSRSQKHKMIIKLENYDMFKKAYDILDKSNEKFLVDEETFSKEFVYKKDNVSNPEFRVGDIFIPRNISIKNAKKILENRLGRVGNRQELVLKYGYDVKFGSHVIRILCEAKELLQTKNLIFPLKERDLILEIKQGKYKCNEVFDMATQLENEINSLKYEPFKNNYDEVNHLLISLINNFQLELIDKKYML